MDDSPKPRSGCFPKGCLIVFLASIAMAVMVGAGAFYLYGKMLDRFTSVRPADLQIVAPSRDAIQVARLTLDRFRTALANNREETIEFTSADLNALVSADSEFAGARGIVCICHGRFSHDDGSERSRRFRASAALSRPLV